MFKKRSILHSGKIAKRKRRVLYAKSVLLLVLVIGAVAGSAYGLSRPEIFIENISVSGLNVLTKSDVLDVAERTLEGKYLFLFPKRNIIFYPRGGIEAGVLDALKRVRDVTVSRNGFQEISITIAEREPYATWCGSAPPIKENIGSTTENASDTEGTCYFLDDGGYVFALSPKFTGDVYFRYYGELKGDNPISSQYLSESRFRELSLFLAALQEFGIEGSSLVLSSGGVELKTKVGLTIRFNEDQDFTDVLNNLESVLPSETFRDRDLAEVEYIDFRFGDRVFYQFKE